MKKRLFVAIELPDKLKEELSRNQQEIIKDLIDPPRLTAKENLHITVSFIGSVEVPLIDGLIAQLKEIQNIIKPFYLQFKETIFAPPGRFRSMIWAVYEKNSDYTRLTKEVNTIVVSYLKKHRHPIYISSHRDPIPHITLARFKHKAIQQHKLFPPLPTKILDISSFILMQSKLTPQGPAYSVVESYPLL